MEATLPGGGSEMIRICVAGHRQLFLAGLTRILSEAPFQVVQTAASLAEAVTNDGASSIVVLDRPETWAEVADSLEEFRRKDPAPRLVVISDTFDEAEMITAFGAGVHGYLLANISPEALRESLNLVVLGEHVFPSKLVSILCSRGRPLRRPADHPAESPLSEREAEIIGRLAEGMPNKVIASELAITEATVKVHLKSILRKLGVANRTQAAIWAINNGLAIEPLPTAH